MAAWLAGPLPVVVLVGLHLVLGLSAIGRKSMTFDEVATPRRRLQLLGRQ